MGIADNDHDEVRRLRRTMRDLVALSTLSAVWAGLGPEGIAKSLTSVLLSTLNLDFLYVRLAQPGSMSFAEAARSKHRQNTDFSISEATAALAPLLANVTSNIVATVADPFGTGMLRMTPTQVGLSGEHGFLVAGSQRIDFPTEQERLLLGVAANQAATVIQRQAIEQALQESKEHLRAVFDSAGDGLYVMGPDTRCTYLNPTGAAMLGYEAEELVGQPLHDIVHHTHPDGRHHPVSDCPIAFAAREGAPARVDDDVFWHKDGTPVPVTYSVSPIIVDGKPAGAVVTYRDITERKLAEAEQERLLRTVDAERERLADVFHQSPSFMCVLAGPEHVFERANDRYIQLVGHREILGKPLREALPEVAEQGFVALLDNVYRTGEAYMGTDVPVLLHRRPGAPAEERCVDFVYQALRGPDGQILGVFVQGIDLTERKQSENARKREADQRALLLDVARCILEAPTAGAGLANQVFEMIRGHLGADILFNYKLHADGVLRLVSGAGIPDELQAAAEHLELMQAFCGTAAAQREPLVADVNRISSDSAGAFVRRMGARAYACHPLLGRDGQVLGTFSVASTTRDAFAPEEVQFLQTVSHFLALAWDRQKTEDELARVSAESERRRRLYETILSNTPDLAYVFDLNHRFTYANEVLLKMWGRTWQDAIGKNCLELGYEPWHAEMHDREIEQVKSTKQPIRGEVPFAGTFGRRIHDYIFVPVLGSDGEVEAIAGTTRDVTDLKKSEEEMAVLYAMEKQRAARLAQIANASKSMNVVLSMDSIAQTLTEEGRSIIGAHQAVTSLTISENWAQAINAVSLSDKYAGYRGYSAMPDGSGIYAEVCRTNRPMRMTQQELEAHPAWKGFGKHAKEHPAMRGWLAVPLIGHGGKNLGLLQLSDKYDGEFTEEDEAILVQLAAIASASLENARLYEQVREQDRRKDEFLATLAHELRNPLAPVRTGLALLKLAPTIDATVRPREIMERQVGHMVRLIDDLMEVSRITSGKVQLKLERIDVRAVLETALELSRPLIEECRHKLFVSMPKEPLSLNADLTRVAQVVSNLLNNAAKYTPEGGRIELSAETDLNNNVLIRVRDNGVGLTAEALPKVFELFSQVGKTLDRSQGGLGIGLALVRRLVEMHGGKVTAKSEGLGQGSTFTVRLPLAATQLNEFTEDKLGQTPDSVCCSPDVGRR